MSSYLCRILPTSYIFSYAIPNNTCVYLGLILFRAELKNTWK